MSFEQKKLLITDAYLQSPFLCIGFMHTPFVFARLTPCTRGSTTLCVCVCVMNSFRQLREQHSVKLSLASVVGPPPPLPSTADGAPVLPVRSLRFHSGSPDVWLRAGLVGPSTAQILCGAVSGGDSVSCTASSWESTQVPSMNTFK